MADPDTGSKPEEASEGKAAEKDQILAEINKKIEDAFDVFDHEYKTVN